MRPSPQRRIHPALLRLLAILSPVLAAELKRNPLFPAYAESWPHTTWQSELGQVFFAPAEKLELFGTWLKRYHISPAKNNPGRCYYTGCPASCALWVGMIFPPERGPSDSSP